MTYAESIQFLYDLQMFGANFGLENTHRLATHAGKPQDPLKFIHVAGTNGKGSVCAMLESIYRTAGFKTGLYSSPHLIHFGERIRINNQPLSETELISLTERMKHLLASGTDKGWWPPRNEKTSSNQNHPTFFEVVTVMALLHFAESQCDIVLWETGLGGRLDATNIVTPLACVITNISLEHSAYLGDTIQEIATEKCGIIKPGIPVFTGSDNAEALGVIREFATNQKASFSDSPDTESAKLASELFPGSYQEENAHLALAIVNGLQNHLRVSSEIQRAALRGFTLPGRLQRITRGGQTILIDGAHNPASVRALRESLNNSIQPVIFGCFEDKDLDLILEELLPIASKLLLVPVDSPRSAKPKDLRQRVMKLKPDSLVETFDSITDSFRAVENEPEVLVTGSLYLVGEALQLLSTGETADRSEQSLNDWTASSK